MTMRTGDQSLPAAPPIHSLRGHGEADEREIEDLRDSLRRCQWCASYHLHVCPYIKIMEFHPDGTTSRVVLRDRPLDTIFGTLAEVKREADKEMAELLAELDKDTDTQDNGKLPEPTDFFGVVGIDGK